ncbi:MAG: S26 family signal peptidase [Planctomycetales bacterium]
MEFVLVMFVAYLGVKAWLIEPFMVSSGSMAYTLLGAHYQFVCEDCEYPFPCGAEPRPESYRAVCPNCGHSRLLREDPPRITHGDGVLVFKQAFLLEPPRRWDVAVFRPPAGEGTSDGTAAPFVKRVVGMPGEAIQIQDGDVYINGAVQRKALRQQRATAVFIHDAAHESSAPRRWKSDSLETKWRTRQGKLYRPITPGQADASLADWLTYHHWRRMVGEDVILDEHHYNLSTSRAPEQFNEVNDLMLFCRVAAQGVGELLFRISDGRNRFEVRVVPSRGTVALFHDGNQVQTGAAEGSLLEKPAKVELSMMDRQILFAVDGELLLDPYQYDDTGRSYFRTTRPLAIGAKGVGVSISQLRVYRDVYYTDPLSDQLDVDHGAHGLSGGSDWGISAPHQLGPDEYFVLGDNSVSSKDSRGWTSGPAVHRDMLIGRPFVVYWPNRWTRWGNREFQVPDGDAIRYIR